MISIELVLLAGTQGHTCERAIVQTLPIGICDGISGYLE